MAILADYVIPPDKTPEDLAKDLEAMVSGVNTLSLQATTGTAVVVSPCTDSGTYIVDPSIGIFGRSCNGGLGTSQRLGELYLGFSPTGIFRGCRVGVDCTE